MSLPYIEFVLAPCARSAAPRAGKSSTTDATRHMHLRHAPDEHSTCVARRMKLRRAQKTETPPR
ncbi:hypothetical protein A2U01_0100525, partial [Trifolium medium]|nr:hypothetical protein [Trifolium medium]